MIIRVVRRERAFTTIDNAALRDDRLSFKATGLLAYLLSMPDEWSPRREHLATVKSDGVASIRAALKELADAGYLVRKIERGADGKTFTVSEIRETPLAENPPLVDAEIAPPLAGKPLAGFPLAGNPPPKEVPIKDYLEEDRAAWQEIAKRSGRERRGVA